VTLILVVEDDEYKSADICRVIADIIPAAALSRAQSVTSALRSISSRKFDLVVLDMSLPTFDLSGPGGGGSPQSQGGVEVLRLAKKLGSTIPVIVVTQYPDVEFDGLEVPLAEAAVRLSARFGMNVLGCIAYEFDRGTWKEELIARLTEIIRDCTSDGATS
jgi:CheY-like chemotaxis protein